MPKPEVKKSPAAPPAPSGRNGKAHIAIPGDAPKTVPAPFDYEKIARLHQYYRDCLTQSYEFPGLGNYSVDFVRWAVGSVDSVRLAELLSQMQNSGLSAEHDLALRLMLFTIQQANLALDRNNMTADHSVSSELAASIRQGILRVLTLHQSPSYLNIAAQLLYRLKATGEFMALSQLHPEVFKGSLVLQAIVGFTHSIAGNYAEALRYLDPLTVNPKAAGLPLVELSAMSCHFLAGDVPTAPLTFETLNTGLETLDHLLGRITPMEMIQPLERPVTCPVVLTACNDRYFYHHAVNLAASIHATNRGKLALHFHLYSPSAGVLAEIDRLRSRLPGLQIGVSAERGTSAMEQTPAYFAAVRFVRAHQLLAYYRSELCIIDSDAQFNRVWEHFLAQFPPETEIALSCPPDTPFWEHILATVGYYKPTPLVEHFLAKVAQFIARNIERQTVCWMTDQTALGACDHRYTKDHPAVSHVPYDLLVDTRTHHPQAPIWSVTTRKRGFSRYDGMRERLGQKYGFLPCADRDFIFKHVSRVKAPVFFLQIGAMDGVTLDPIHEYVKAGGWHGILVEPLPDMVARLRSTYAQQSGLVFETVGIAEREETRIMYRIPAETVAKAGLPLRAAALSSLNRGHLSEFPAHTAQETVKCTTLAALLARHKPEKIDVLQIDASGYDAKILKQFDFARYHPAIVTIEFQHLAGQEKSEAEALLLSNGYLFYQDEGDLFAFRRDVFFTDQTGPNGPDPVRPKTQPAENKAIIS